MHGVEVLHSSPVPAFEKLHLDLPEGAVNVGIGSAQSNPRAADGQSRGSVAHVRVVDTRWPSHCPVFFRFRGRCVQRAFTGGPSNFGSMARYHIHGIGLVALLMMVAQGCATTTPSRPVDLGRDTGDAVVAAADGVVGAPYRFGGSSPRGFDCSGLVHYAHRLAGIPVPRSTGAQMRRARSVLLDDLRAGDVLFFKLEGNKVSHVGIYAGTGSFIHAPSSGKSVSYASLRSVYWSSRLIGAGRFD